MLARLACTPVPANLHHASAAKSVGITPTLQAFPPNQSPRQFSRRPVYPAILQGNHDPLRRYRVQHQGILVQILCHVVWCTYPDQHSDGYFWPIGDICVLY